MPTVGEQSDGSIKMEKAEKPHLSISQLNMLSKCGEQYRQRYVLGRKIPPGVALIVGGAVDRTVSTNLTGKMKGLGLMTLDAVADAARDALNCAWEGGVVLTADEAALGVKAAKGQAVDKSVRLAKLHAREMAPAIEPTHIQRKIEVELPGYPYDLLGYIDIQEGSKSIRDTKTTGKTPAADIADKDDQLTTYAMMAKVTDGVIPEQLCLDYLIDTKIPQAKTFSTQREEDDFKPLLNRVEAASKAIQAGVFIPAKETDWVCNPRWCGYWNQCPYVKKSRRPAA